MSNAEIPPSPFTCPACGGLRFLEGPHGGMSITFCCGFCGARFVDHVMRIERQRAKGDERETFRDTGFVPRTHLVAVEMPKVQWFGRSWGAPICADDNHVPTPQGVQCAMCGQDVAEKSGVLIPHVGRENWELQAYDLACFLKMIGARE